MIKILFVVENLESGGAERVLVNLVNQMNKKEFDITVMTLFSDGVNQKRLCPNIKYICRHKPKFKGISHIVRHLPEKLLYQYYVGKQYYDIVVAYMTGIPAKVVAGAPYKKVGWLHAELGKVDISSLEIVSNVKKDANCYRNYNAIVGVSECIVNSLKNKIDVSDNVYVVYNTNETDEIIELSKRKVNFSFDKNSSFLLISVGKLDPVKGYDRLIRICSDLIKEGYRFKLCIVGEGRCRSELEELISDLSLEDSVFLLGFDENPYKYLSRSDIFVCSSYSEGLSTATTEALILGLPIVSTDVSGAREILGDNNEWGIVTGVDDESLYQGLKKMLSDPALREHYREATKERAPFFDKKNTVAQAEKLFYEVMKK